MGVVPSSYHQCIKFPFHGSKVTILASTSYTYNMKKYLENFVLANRESTDYHDNKLKQIEQSLKLRETRMGEYQIEQVFSLTSLPESPRHYGRSSKVKRP